MAVYGGSYIDGVMNPQRRQNSVGLPDPYADPFSDPYGNPGDNSYDPTMPGNAPPTTPPTSTPPGTTPPGETRPGPYDPPTTTTPPKPPVDQSGWQTGGYSKPAYTAEDFGNAPAGWDQTKWTNTNHQTPKYVVGRIMASAGDLKLPENRAKAIKMIQDAYPGTTFDGKDVVTIPGIGKVDIFGGASAGAFTPTWQPIDGGTAGGSAIQSFMNGSNYATPKSATPETVSAHYRSLLQQFMQNMQGFKTKF